MSTKMSKLIEFVAAKASLVRGYIVRVLASEKIPGTKKHPITIQIGNANGTENFKSAIPFPHRSMYDEFSTEHNITYTFPMDCTLSELRGETYTGGYWAYLNFSGKSFGYKNKQVVIFKTVREFRGDVNDVIADVMGLNDRGQWFLAVKVAGNPELESAVANSKTSYWRRQKDVHFTQSN